MGRDLFRLEKGIHITGENADSGVALLFGSGAPGGDTGVQDAAEVGSIYQRTSGELWLKISSGSGADKWLRIATLNDITSLSWRSETIRAATGDVAPATGSSIDLVANPFGDDDAPLLTAADFAIDEYILFGYGGTPKLMRISAIASPSITVVDADDPLANNDMFIVRNFLPDSPDAQEKQAILLYNGTVLIKIADFNWDIATGINISSGYTAQNGSVSSADTVESAIQKLDGNQIDLITLSGEAQGAINHGSFTGETIPDNSTTRASLQALETRIENKGAQNAVTSVTVLDEFLVDDILSAKWLVVVKLDSNKLLTKSLDVHGMHNGHAGADATLEDDAIAHKLLLGGFTASVAVTKTGSGATQKLQLTVAAPSAISARSHRYAQVLSQSL